MKKLLIAACAAVCLARGQTIIQGSRTFTGAINYGGTSGAGTDAYTCTVSGLTAYATGLRVTVKADVANTGAASLNCNSLGVKTIKKAAGGVTTDLADNDIRANQIIDAIYDGTNFQIQSTLGNAVTGSFALDFASAPTWTLAGTTHGLGTCDIVAVAWITATTNWEVVSGDRLRCETAAGASQYNVVATWTVSQAGRLVIIKGGVGSGGGGGGGFADPLSNGIMVRTASNTATPRSVAGTTNEVCAADGDGVAGNPTLSLCSILNLASKSLIAPSSATLPGTCSVGQLYFDTDATTGRRLYGCESTNTWVLQGDGAGAGAGDIGAVGNCATGDCFQTESGNKIFASPSNGSSGQMLARASVAADIPLTFTGSLSGTGAPTYGAITSGRCEVQTLAKTGAVVGTSGNAAASTALTAGVFVMQAYVIATDVVSVPVCNFSAGSDTPGALTINYVLVGDSYR